MNVEFNRNKKELKVTALGSFYVAKNVILWYIIIMIKFIYNT